ncbi:MAG: HAD hydrolase family protein [Ferruginibacter sp.]
MNVLAGFKNIKLFVLDADGVLTDGSLLIFEDGQQVRRMNIKDGYALQLAIKKGYRILVISGAKSKAIKKRLSLLGIKDAFFGVEDKVKLMLNYISKFRFEKEQVLYMGDDMPDLECMKMAGLATCPADAVPEIKEIAQYISPLNGGQGCVRDIIEKVLKLNGHWQHNTALASR